LNIYIGFANNNINQSLKRGGKVSEYNMSIFRKITTCDRTSVDHYLSIISPQDNLVITLENESHENTEILDELFKRNKLMIYGKKFISSDKCVIKVTKDKHFNE